MEDRLNALLITGANMNLVDIIQDDIDSQPVGASQEACLCRWLERAIYLWYRLSGFHFHISEIKRLNLDGYWIKSNTLARGGGKQGILRFFEYIRKQLEQERQLNPTSTVDWNYSDDDLNRMINLDVIVRIFGIPGALERIVEIMEYMLSRIGIHHPVGHRYSAHGSKFDNDQLVHDEIYPYQYSQYQVGSSSSSMPGNGDGDHGRVPRNGNRVDPHQSSMQVVDSYNSSSLRNNEKMKQPLSATSLPPGFPPRYAPPPTRPISSNFIDNGLYPRLSQGTFRPGNERISGIPSLQFSTSLRSGFHPYDARAPTCPTRSNFIGNAPANESQGITTTVALAQPVESPSLNTTEGRRMYRLLIRKQLQRSDISNGRIVLPKKKAEAHLPSPSIGESRMLEIKDMSLRGTWHFKYSYWNNHHSRMHVLENTREFVRMHHLRVGDYILLFRDRLGNLVIHNKKMG